MDSRTQQIVYTTPMPAIPLLTPRHCLASTCRPAPAAHMTTRSEPGTVSLSCHALEGGSSTYSLLARVDACVQTLPAKPFAGV